MEFKTGLTDDSVLAEIGRRIKKRRIEFNMTQEMLAREAGVSKRTLERIESGVSVQLKNFIRVLRKLDLLHRMEDFLPRVKPSPMELLENKNRERKRASAGKQKNTGPWTWDEK